MDEKILAGNIMKTIGSSLVNEDEVLLGSDKIAERYTANLVKAGYNLMDYDDCINAIHHYVICAGYENKKFVFVLSEYRN